MKLLNRSLQYLSVSILLIVSIWSVVLYFNLLDEIYDSIDDGLDNYKLLIIRKAERDTTVLLKNAFDESNYSIHAISEQQALAMKDVYKDTMLYMPYEEDLEPVRLLTSAFRMNGKYYQLQVISSMVEEDDLIEDLFWGIVWLYIILIVSIVVVNNWVLRKLWKPFYGLLQHLRAFRIDRDRQLPELHTDTKEFMKLKMACDELVRHAVEAYSGQKQFTENAAHELQTPLAIITNRLELLLEKGNATDEDAETLAEVLQTVERLKQLNRSLLLLSRIENRQFPDAEDVEVAQVVSDCVGELQELADFKQLEIQVVQHASPTVQADPMLVNVLVSNLIRNAVRHNMPNGTVTITIDGNSLQVCNTSSVGKLDASQVFKRFQKGNDPSQGTGLGLAIAKAICQLYGFTVSYTYNGQHCFEVRFGSA